MDIVAIVICLLCIAVRYVIQTVLAGTDPNDSDMWGAL